MFVYEAKDLNQQNAWEVLHSLQCDLAYFLQETNSSEHTVPKHALDMILKRTVCEIQRAKEKIQVINVGR